MPKSLYNDNIAKLVEHDAVQVPLIKAYNAKGVPVIVLDPENDIVQGSVSIDRYCVTGNTIEMGSACAAELSFKLYNNDGRFNDTTFEGQELAVRVTLQGKDIDVPTMTVWDGATVQAVSAGYSGTNRIRVVFSGGGVLTSTMWHTSHFDELGEGDGPGVYKTGGNELAFIAPRAWDGFGLALVGDAVMDLAIVNQWLTEQAAAGTPFTLTQHVTETLPSATLSMGYFTVDEAPRKTEIITVKALDRMAQFNRVHDGSILFPCTVISLLRSICSKVNITYNESSTLANSGRTIQTSPEELNGKTYTYREYLVWIAEITGTCAYIDENGQLTLARYEDYSTNVATIVAELTPGIRMDNGADLLENSISVTGLQCTKPDKTEYKAGADGYRINIQNNPLLNQMSAAVTNNVLSTIWVTNWRNLTYRPYSATTKSIPYLWPLDKVNYITKDGETVPTLVTHATYNVNGNSKIQAKGKSSTTSGYASTDPLTARERLIIDTMKQETVVKLSSMEEATIQLNAMISNSMGMYYTTVEDGFGGTKVYAHNSATLEASNTIYTMTDQGFAWTNSGWSQGEPVWSYGIDKLGNAVLKTISTYHISADDIEAGELRSQNDVTIFNLNDGSINMGGKLTYTLANGLTVKGKITATSGKIGGWNIIDEAIKKTVTVDGVTYEAALSPVTGDDSIVFHVSYNSASTMGMPFFIRGDGFFYASNAEIEGEITATSGKIGLLNVDSKNLTYGSFGIYPDADGSTATLLKVGTGFSVTGNGVLIATGAQISGKINSKEGSIGGWKIGSTTLSYGSTTGDYVALNGSQIGKEDTEAYVFHVNDDGAVIFGVDGKGRMTAKAGTIGGWKINADSLSGGTSPLDIKLTPGNIRTTKPVISIGNGMGTYAYQVDGMGTVRCNDLYMTGGQITVNWSDSSNAFMQVRKDDNNYTRVYHCGLESVLYGYRIDINKTTGGTIRFYDSAGVIAAMYGYNSISNKGVYNASNSGGVTVKATSSGGFYCQTSSRRYKRDIDYAVDFNPDGLLSLPLRQYRYNHGHFQDYTDNDELFCGFIAEEVEECYPHGVVYNDKGQVQMWDADRLLPPMLDLIQKLYVRVQALEKR